MQAPGYLFQMHLFYCAVEKSFKNTGSIKAAEQYG